MTSTNAPTSGVILNTVGGTLALGNVSVTSSTGAGVSMTASTAAVSATSITVNGASVGLSLSENTGGTFTVSGTTAVSNTTGDGIALAGTGVSYIFGTTNVTAAGQDAIDLTGLAGNATANFGATTINGFGHANDGVNFTGADVTSAFGVTSIQNGGFGTGIDLSSTQNDRTITFAKTSSITSVNVGVQLSAGGTTATTANANFTFGDGEGVVDKASTISATTTVAAVGLNPASGTYNFQDVVFTGTPGFGASAGSALL
ncbi:MAG: hypothetical protein WDN28_08430 [Chthoniobacter sp.]